MIYVRYHRSIYERPSGLLRHCGLLCESDLLSKAWDIRARLVYDGKLTKARASEDEGRFIRRTRFGFGGWEEPEKDNRDGKLIAQYYVGDRGGLLTLFPATILSTYIP